MEQAPLYVVKIRRDYRPWWAFWRKRMPVVYRTWRNGLRTDDVDSIEMFRSLYEPPWIKLNGHRVERAQIWVDGVLYLQIPDATLSLHDVQIDHDVQIELAGENGVVSRYETLLGMPLDYNQVYWPPPEDK
jgi:hypothetical protein